eukprot:6581770-Prorocentrum_lima.AAC.1
MEASAHTFAFTPARPRHKVLVVNGPTRLGKTVWVRQSFGPAHEVYEVNACNMVSPDMRGHDATEHQAILFDEGSPTLIAKNR